MKNIQKIADEIFKAPSRTDLIDRWLKTVDAKQNADGSYDINCSPMVDISLVDHGKLLIRFGRVTGSFFIFDTELTTLEGGPKFVDGSFYCYRNKLKNLIGAPKFVGGEFECSRNKLTSLTGAPKSVGRGFYCHNNTTPFTKDEVLNVCDVKGKIYV